jgi:hypothetical protein
MLNIFLLFFIFSNTPLIVFLKIPAIASFIFFSIASFIINGSKNHRRSATEILLTGIFLATSALSSIYNNTYFPTLYAFLATLYYHTVRSFDHGSLVLVINWAAKLLYFFAIFGALAVALDYLIGLPSYRLGTLILTPLGVIYPNEPFARASGFFFEPGQFSFYICWVICCREVLGLNRQLNIKLLVLGFATQSLAHLVFCVTYALYIIFVSALRIRHKILSAGALLFTVAAISFTGFADWMLARGETFWLNPEAWARWASFENARLELSSLNAVFFGPSAELAARELALWQLHEHGDGKTVSIYGENILSPLIYGGLTSSWPFYLLIFVSLIGTIMNKPAMSVLFILTILTIQRPYTLEFPYALAFATLIALILLTSKRLVGKTNVSYG